MIGICAFALLIALKEIPPLLKNGLKWELWLFILSLLIGTGYSSAYCLQVSLKNPTEWIYWGYKPVSDFFFQLLN